jgi:hypothetical protein
MCFYVYICVNNAIAQRSSDGPSMCVVQGEDVLLLLIYVCIYIYMYMYVYYII